MRSDHQIVFYKSIYEPKPCCIENISPFELLVVKSQIV